MDLDFLCCCGGSSGANDDDNSYDGKSGGGGKRRRQGRGRSRTPRTNTNASFDEGSTTSRDNSPFSFSSWWCRTPECGAMHVLPIESDDAAGAQGRDHNLSTVQISRRPRKRKSEIQMGTPPSLSGRRSMSRSDAASSERGTPQSENSGDRRIISTSKGPSGLLRPPGSPPRSLKSRTSRETRIASSGRSLHQDTARSRTPSWGALYQRVVRSREKSMEGEPMPQSRLPVVVDNSVDGNYDSLRKGLPFDKIIPPRNDSFPVFRQLGWQMRRRQ